MARRVIILPLKHYNYVYGSLSEMRSSLLFKKYSMLEWKSTHCIYSGHDKIICRQCRVLENYYLSYFGIS